MFCTNSPLQEATAAGLEEANDRDFFAIQTREYQERRDFLTSVFDKLGMKYTMPQGTYFVLLDISEMEFPDDYPFPESMNGRGRDFRYD